MEDWFENIGHCSLVMSIGWKILWKIGQWLVDDEHWMENRMQNKNKWLVDEELWVENMGDGKLMANIGWKFKWKIEKKSWLMTKIGKKIEIWIENIGKQWLVDDGHWTEIENGWLMMNIGWKIGWKIWETW